jgi:hypothetical protein
MVKTGVDVRQKLHESVAMMVHFGATGLVLLSTACNQPLDSKIERT